MSRPLNRTIIAAAGGGAIALAAAAVTVGLAQSAGQGGRFLAGGLAAWGVVCVALWRGRAPDVGFTPATWITVGRALLISAVAGFLLGPAPSELAGWIAGALYTLAAIGDGFDGWVARRSGTSTQAGAMLDVRVDALGLLVAPLVAVVWGRLPVWYLLLAFAYPIFQAAVWLRGRLRLPTFRERLRPDPRARALAGIQMGVVAASLFPVLPRAVTWPVATVTMLPTLALFIGQWRVVTGRRAAVQHADAQRLHA
jgi:CDP-diacylglycerol--glycerol-3-phosphate 3-phosphatidyltransferase